MPAFLEVSLLTKSFGGVSANDNVDFSMDSGTIQCIIGPNGSGKTTFVSMVSGHQFPDSGRIYFKGRDITSWSANRVARTGIVRKFQVPSLYRGLTVRENLLISVMGTDRPRHTRAARVEEVASLVRLTEVLDRQVSTLAHGHTQWLEIGMLIANDAQLMLLDEPTAGMTPEETRATGVLVRRLVQEFGVAAIIIEHDINFLRELRAPVTVFNLGRVLTRGSMEEIERNDQVRKLYLGEEV